MSFSQYQRRMALQVFDKMCQHTFYVRALPKNNYWAVILYDKDNMTFDLVRYNSRAGDFRIDTLTYEAALDMRLRGNYYSTMYQNLLVGIWPKLKNKCNE